MSVESTEAPAQSWDGDACAKPRADCVLGDVAGEVCRTHPRRESEPRERFEFFIEEESGETPGSGLRIGKGRFHRIATGEVGVAVGRAIEENAEMVIVVLMESKEANLQIVAQ